MLDILFFIASMCSVNTCMVAEIGPTKVITICSPVVLGADQIQFRRHYFVEPETGRKLVLQVQNCPGL